MHRPVLALAIAAAQACPGRGALGEAGGLASSWIVQALAALGVTAVVTMLGVYVVDVFRAAGYRRFEDASEAAVCARFPLASVDESPAEAVYQLSRAWVSGIYDQVNAAQTRYHNAVVSSSACLGLAFAALALSTLSQTNWCPPAGVSWDAFDLLLGWIEAWGLLGVLLLFLYGRLSNRPWINRRAGAELLRQYQFLSILFPTLDAEGTVEQRLEREAATVYALVREGPLAGVGVRAEDYWSKRRAAIAARPIADGDLSPEAVVLFLRRRARRQLIWFSDAKARLEHIAGTRAFILLVLYCFALGLALVKLGYLVAKHFGSKVESPVPLLPLLLIVTGISGAMTAYYFNQNARSLIHRYNTQQRFISDWLTEFGKTCDVTDLAKKPLTTEQKREIRERVLEFEHLMIEELIDWAHISTHDAIELAP